MILHRKRGCRTCRALRPFRYRYNRCSGLAVRGNELAARFNAICENMEGAAAAQVCTLYEVPFLELRGISNLVEDRNTARVEAPAGLPERPKSCGCPDRESGAVRNYE